MSSMANAHPPATGGCEPVWVWTPGIDTALDEAETEWITPQQFATDPRFGGRDRSALQHAVARNLYGLKQSRRRVTIGPKPGSCRSYSGFAYAFWRMARCFNVPEADRPTAAEPPAQRPRPPIRQAVEFTPPRTEADTEPEAPQPVTHGGQTAIRFLHAPQQAPVHDDDRENTHC